MKNNEDARSFFLSRSTDLKVYIFSKKRIHFFTIWLYLLQWWLNYYFVSKLSEILIRFTRTFDRIFKVLSNSQVKFVKLSIDVSDDQTRKRDKLRFIDEVREFIELAEETLLKSWTWFTRWSQMPVARWRSFNFKMITLNFICSIYVCLTTHV